MHETFCNINIYYIVINGTFMDSCQIRRLWRIWSNIFFSFSPNKRNHRMQVLFSVCFDHRERKTIFFSIFFFFIHFITFALSIKVCLLFIPNAEHDYYFLIILNEKNYYYCRCRYYCWLLKWLFPSWCLIFTIVSIASNEQECIAGRRLQENFCVTWFPISHSFSSIKWIEHDVIVNYH